jgi:hypothetical protein
MSQSVVNTNISSVTDPNGSRGEIPSSVMAYDMGAATGTAGAQAFALVAGTERVGAYQGTIAAGTSSVNGVTQLITLTFATAFIWDANSHYCDVSFVSTAADDQSATASAGTGNASFDPTVPTNSIVIKRTAGKLAAGAVNLTAAHMVVRVRTRGVAVKA